MIRITNSMMNNNTKNNINLTKTSSDKLNTMVATGQKITKPSDDPVIAIRALRLNTNLSQLNQYYEKNIPDAQAWLKITETALIQTDGVFTKIKENLTTGASDDNTASDRMKILESLKALREQVYSSGNADYADRTVFTGYRTSESLTVLETDDLSKIGYSAIVEPVDADKMEKIKFVKGADSPSSVQDVTYEDVTRVRLAYDNLDDTDVTINYKAGGTAKSLSLTPEKLTGTAADDDLYTDGKTHLIADTGELIIGDDEAGKAIKAALEDRNAEMTVTYARSSFQPGELRPEHYFACIDKDDIHYNYSEDGVTPDFKEQEIKYEVSFNQTIAINTHASDVYLHAVGRDIDELVKATQAVIDADKALEKLKNSGKKSGDAEYDAAEKAYNLYAENCQKMFSHALTKFDNYADTNNLAIANIGSLSERLSVTKERVSDQIQSFKTLADDNINAELTDTAIDLSNAELALQAAQMAAAKIAQQTLLNYL